MDADMEALAALLAQFLAAIPEELRLRLTDAARALLQALRALLDWLASLLSPGEAERPVEVHDIPIL
jgi:DNA-binding HxlR family transcriptional regulator